jgi:hypothetical protein
MTKPAAAASPAGLPEDREMLFAYRQWLHHEGRLLGDELFPELGKDADRFIPETFARHFQFPLDQPWTDVQKPSARARAVLEVVGAISPQPAAIEDLAAAEFEPWPKDTEQIPDNANLTGRVENCIVTLRIAWKAMQRSKPELVTMFRSMDEKIARELISDFVSSIGWLKHFVGILEAAETLLLSAGAVIELEERAAEAARG